MSISGKHVKILRDARAPGHQTSVTVDCPVGTAA